MEKLFLFQGDSITDAGRDRGYDECRGSGYPTIVAARLGLDRPGEYRFINRGVSGDRIVELNARIKEDIINLKPDVLTILIGINDVWHELNGNHNGVSDTKYRRTYFEIIEEIKEALPGVKIFILEPFVLKASATEKDWDYFRTETDLRAKSAKQVAETCGCRFVPLQAKFDALCAVQEPSYWLIDGVHPTAAGHQVIADELIKAFKNETGE